MSSQAPDRRAFLKSAALAGGSLLVGCRDFTKELAPELDLSAGVLRARPRAPTTLAPEGLQALGLSTGARDGRLYVPPGHRADEPLPLLLLLHGAGGDSASWFGSYEQRARDARLILLAPDSRGSTWDLVMGNYGEDVAFIDAALGRTFDRCAVNPAKIAVAGFSDGASYSLGLGLLNGDLFSKVIAFSPGFLANTGLTRPGVFVSHGIQDPILPINQCGRPIAQQLRADGYAVTYLEFEGGHQVPQSTSDAAITWLMA